ncbi:MAG: fumarylacetoacetate hydrolase family protein [Halobacteriota archaeon]|nr:fumarylacetoacetate hydrolase family protein [Halobacteriota archaeon]
MKLVRFLKSGEAHLGTVIADKYIIDLGLSGISDIYTLLRYYPESMEIARSAGSDLELSGFFTFGEIELLPPIPRPTKMICLGLNYKDHALEFGGELSEEPMIFAKSPTAVIGPGDEIILPTRETDYEVELAIVMARRCSHVSKEKAKDYVLGFTILNDVTARDIQARDNQFFRSKSFDTFAPIGPCITTVDEISDPDNLDIECRLNGILMQKSNTRNLIFNVYEVVSFISESVTLEPGDIIGTGTPGGVGFKQDPPIFLGSGDELELTIENIGTLKNTVK